MKKGILLLTGGKSSRMHQDKAMLPYLGVSFLEHLSSKFDGYCYKYLSVNQNQEYHFNDYINVVDEYKEIGPMGGIVSAFHQSDIDAFFVVAVDMPYISEDNADQLFDELEDYDGVFVDDNDHFYTMGAVYTRKMLPVFETMIENHNYQLYKAVKSCNIKVLITMNSSCFENINTPEEYEKLLKEVKL